MSHRHLAAACMAIVCLALGPAGAAAQGAGYVGTAPDAVGRAGSAGRLGLPFHHADGAARRPGRQGVPDRGGSGATRAGDRCPERRAGEPARPTDGGDRQRRPEGGGRARLLQQPLAGPRHDDRRHPAHVAHRGPAERQDATAHPRGRGTAGGIRETSRRHRHARADAGRLGRGPGGERPAVALRHRFQLRTADDAGRLQQQRPGVPDPQLRRTAQRDESQRADRPA